MFESRNQASALKIYLILAEKEIPTIPEKLEQNGTDEKLKNFSEENDLTGDEVSDWIEFEISQAF